MTHDEALKIIMDVFPGSQVISETVTGKKESKGMGNSTESPYSMTFKTGKSNLFTVRGDTAAELATNLGAASEPIATENGPMSLLDMIREIESSLGAPASSHEQSQGQAQSQQASLTPPCPTCGGSTSQKSGTGSKGPWTGYFCNSGDKSHKVQWAK